MKDTRRPILSVLLIMLVMGLLDLLWLGYIAREHYHNTIGPLMRLNAQGELQAIMSSVVAVYITMSLGLYYFVLLESSTVVDAFKRGALYGAVLYGTYEFTNHAILSGWPSKVILIDCAWGMFLMAATAAIVKRVIKSKSNC